MRRRRFRAKSALFAGALCANCLACSGETRVDLLDRLREVEAGPDASSAGASAETHLLHRYSFGGEGTQVVDSQGGPDGTLRSGAVLDGAGHAVLDGKDDFVDLPNGLLSSLSSATLIAWLSWNGGPCWQRVFDFGSSDAGEGEVGNATSSVFATPLRCPGTGPATAFETSESFLGAVDSDAPFPVLQNTSLAVVLDPPNREIRLYVAGKRLGTSTFSSFNVLSDVNDWLGRSQWVQDIYLRGSFDEFRVYDVALDDEALGAVDAAGPDTANR